MENQTENEVEDTKNSDEENETLEAQEEAEAKADQNSEDEYKDKYYYLAAEMQNMQRRFEKERENLLKYGTENILRDLIEVIDNFERTLGFISADEDEKVKNIVVGIDMINKQFLETLKKHGLQKVEALGKEFDPNFHEALAQQPAEGKKDMEIIQVHQPGYKLNERLIRPAKVVVAKN